MNMEKKLYEARLDIQEEAPENATDSKSNKPKKHFIREHESLLITATVIAAMAYQAAINPPGGVAGVDAYKDIDPPPPANYNHYYLKPGDSLVAHFYSTTGYRFWLSNTISFMASLIIIFIYVTGGATLKHWCFTWIIRAAMWINLTSMTFTYVYAVMSTTPSEKRHKRRQEVLFACYTWFVVVGITCLVVIFRIVRKIKSKRATRKKNTSDQFTAASSSTPTINVV